MDWIDTKLAAGRLAGPDGAGCVVADAFELAAVAGRAAGCWCWWAAGCWRRSCTWRRGRWRSRFCFGFSRSGRCVCAVLMITSRKPVYAALWFALVTFSTCGLFLLQSAPFLAAATIIVYAGAIIVTFLFVMMLAQQAGATAYDQRARQPLLATIVAFVLLGALLYTIKIWDTHRAVAAAAEVAGQRSRSTS